MLYSIPLPGGGVIKKTILHFFITLCILTFSYSTVFKQLKKTKPVLILFRSYCWPPCAAPKVIESIHQGPLKGAGAVRVEVSDGGEADDEKKNRGMEKIE